MNAQSGGRAYGAGLKHGVVARRLAQFGPFNDAETNIIRDVCQSVATPYPIRSVIGLPRDGAETLRFVASGWMVRVRELKDGRRQLMQLFLPGDAIANVPENPRSHFLQAITPVQIIDGSAIGQAAARPDIYPGLANALNQMALRERALLMDYVVRLGRQTALERVAHLLIEVHYRLLGIGMAEHDELPFRMTQEAMSDLLGLSPVHVNRTLMTLKRTGMISIAHGRVHLLDVPGLEKLSEFRPPV